MLSEDLQNESLLKKDYIINHTCVKMKAEMFPDEESPFQHQNRKQIDISVKGIVVNRNDIKKKK